MSGYRRKGLDDKIVTVMRRVLIGLGVVLIVAIIIALTGFQQHGVNWLSSVDYKRDCDFILLLPAGPIPSPTMLARTYIAAREHRKNPKAKIIISHKTEPPIERSTIWGIRDELILRGVPESDILLEKKARNTAEHAKYIKESGLANLEKHHFLIVTSPLHMRRSVMTFKAAGFTNIYGTTRFSALTKEDLGWGQFFRYDLWSAFHTEISVLREISAIIFYKITGRA